jgi:prephenate dehydrogenase
MAGSEQHGPSAARADLFRHKPCVMTSGPYSGSPAAQAVRGLWEALGMRVIEMSAEEHDRCVALVSHLPHAVAALLVQAATAEGEAGGVGGARAAGAMDVASSGFGDTTRVASGDPVVWADIFESNRASVIDALDGFAERLATFRRLLARGDAREEILEILASSKSERDRWVEWRRKQS